MGRWLLLAVLALIVAVTLAALTYDLATNGREQAASSLYSGPLVRVDGTLLAYRRWGNAGTPVVLLGGAAEPSWVWHEVGPLLARGDHRVFALDLPPFGYSERRGPYTMTHWLQLFRSSNGIFTSCAPYSSVTRSVPASRPPPALQTPKTSQRVRPA